MTESSTHFHWTPAAQLLFVEVLARTGSVTRAACAAGKTRDAAYKLQRRKGEAAFAQAWDAAILVARDGVGEDVLALGFAPVEEVTVVNALTGRRHWRRVSPLLGRGFGVGFANRLERAAARIDRDPARRAAAQGMVTVLWDSLAAGPIPDKTGV